MTINERRPEIPKFPREQYAIQRQVAQNYIRVRDYLIAELSKETTAPRHKIKQHVSIHMQDLREGLVLSIQALTEQAVMDAYAQTILLLADELTDEEADEYADKETDTKKKETDALQKYGLPLLFVYEVSKRKKAKQPITLAVARNILQKEEKPAYKEKATEVSAAITERVVRAVDVNEIAFRQVADDVLSDRSQLKMMESVNNSAGADLLRQNITKKGIAARIRDNGQVGLVDEAGRRWKLGHYVNTTIKTEINNAYIESVVESGKEIGADLAVISSHGAKDDCRKWEAVIISMTGKTPGYPTYQDAKASGEIWHPNCQHSVHLIRNTDLLHKDDIAKDKEQRKAIAERLNLNN